MRAHKCKDVSELLDKPKPAFMKPAKIWEQYVRNWCTPEQRTMSYINKKNRTITEGTTQGYGYKSAVARLHEMAEQGKKSSMLSVMINVNMKRGKITQPV